MMKLQRLNLTATTDSMYSNVLNDMKIKGNEFNEMNLLHYLSMLLDSGKKIIQYYIY